MNDERLNEIRERQAQRKAKALPRISPHIPDDWQAIYDIDELLSLLPQLSSSESHRCPHFQPKGEDSGGAYNAQIIIDVTNELLDPTARDRLAAKPTSWYSLLIKQLIQRIANLRVMLAETRTVSSSERRCVWTQDKSDYRWYKTACGRETDGFDGAFCTYCGSLIEVNGKCVFPATGGEQGIHTSEDVYEATKNFWPAPTAAPVIEAEIQNMLHDCGDPDCDGCDYEKKFGERFFPSPVTPSETANAAATEICDYCGIDTSDGERVAEIISRYFPTTEATQSVETQ